MSSLGGIYIEQILTALCSIALMATAWMFVVIFILLCGISFWIRTDTPPEALPPGIMDVIKY